MSYPESRKRGLKPFPKGVSGNPGGPRPALIPELRSVLERNKEATKALVIQKLEPRLEEWIDNVIQTGVEDGDMVKLKMLCEMAMGKMVKDDEEFPLSEEEKLLVLEYRKRKAQVVNE